MIKLKLIIGAILWRVKLGIALFGPKDKFALKVYNLDFLAKSKK